MGSYRQRFAYSGLLSLHFSYSSLLTPCSLLFAPCPLLPALCSLQPRFAQRGNMPLQYRWIFIGEPVLEHLQRVMGASP